VCYTKREKVKRLEICFFKKGKINKFITRKGKREKENK